MNTENLERKTKKTIYGKPQTIQAIFPAGFGEIALNEITTILNNLWFPPKYTSECSLLKNTIRINSIHLFAITELLMRARSLTDIRLILLESMASGKEMFRRKCLNVPWNIFLNKNILLKIKVNSVASHAFHESSLKEILSEILKDHVAGIVSGENTHETTILYADLYKDKLTLSLSLAGQPLYKRGYRNTLSASAPLREDLAFCCIQKALQFAEKINPSYLPNHVYIPFSGTGTFGFEYLSSYFHFSPSLFAREYALQKMSFFREQHFNFLLKKAQENLLTTHQKNNMRIFCIDHSSNAVSALLANLENFKKALQQYGFYFSEQIIACQQKDFFDEDFSKFPKENIFLPLNPPYGMRLSKNTDTIVIYKKIAHKINELANNLQKQHKKLLGIILCPSEETWSIFCNTIHQEKMETYHFMQGGLDIRVCQFLI